MTISAARQQELVNAQSAIARKVYFVVPIQEAFTSQQILNALQRTTRASIQFRTLEGCLNTLCEAGLVCEPEKGHFQRVTPREKSAMQKESTLIEVVEPMPRADAVDLLTELADRARLLAQDIDAAAAVIAEQAASNEESSRKLRQLQQILKSLA